MSALIYAQDLNKAYGMNPLFTNLTVGVSEKDRIGLIGPNGSGKSTLLKILAGLEQTDEGTVTRRQRLRVAYIPQDTQFDPEATIVSVIEDAAIASKAPPNEQVARVQETLGRIGFEDGDQLTGPLSGGWKKRLAIACGLVQDPDLMLLDEPTNHLDLEGMQWLEQLLAQAAWPWVIISHDRWLLERTVNTIIELNPRYPNGMLLVPGNYTEFLHFREAYQQTQTQQAQALAGKVRREEEWLHRGPKARTTKAKYRVDTAHALKAELAETKNRLRQDETNIDFVGSGRKTKQLLVAKQLTKAFGTKPLFHDLDLMLSPGMAIGVLGYNGSGKSTLLKLLAQELTPDAGTVTHADKLQLVYFEQHREQLDPKVSLRRTLSDTGHTVTHRGRTLHLAAWAKRFGFSPEQLDLPVELLSGGEQARTVMARLMLKPADVILIDEPTNDLDIPTREVLEESLREFPGGLILVTHDRYMLEKVCTQFIGLDGQGGHATLADYGQWERWLRKQDSLSTTSLPDSPSKGRPSRRTKAKKLSFREQKEHDTIESRILEAEEVRDALRGKSEDPDIASDHLKIQEIHEALAAAEQTVEQLYKRWTELEEKRRRFEEGS
jgi:ATP-binding cassette subfamily F protein uup